MVRGSEPSWCVDRDVAAVFYWQEVCCILHTSRPELLRYEWKIVFDFEVLHSLSGCAVYVSILAVRGWYELAAMAIRAKPNHSLEVVEDFEAGGFVGES